MLRKAPDKEKAVGTARLVRLAGVGLGFLLLAGAGFAQTGAPQSYLQKLRTVHTPADFQHLAGTPGSKIQLHREPRWQLADGSVLIGSSRGIVREQSGEKVQPFPADTLLPWNEITVIAEEQPGLLWIGTTRGAIRLDQRVGAATTEYFAGRRWLPADRVTAIGFEEPASGHAVWIETPGGFSRIEYRPMTLEQKAEIFEQRVRDRHLRHGLTSRSALPVAGDLSSNRTVPNDNDGLWTAIYLAAECYRYRVTGASDARESARQGIAALMRLESITGISGFPARSMVRLDSEARPERGEWHPTADGQWLWKGDTSSDEIVGHFFAYALYYDLVADEKEKKQIRGVIDRIAAHILDHDYQLVDVDGQPTRWGWWGPKRIWTKPDETGLQALQILSHLQVARHITGNSRYQKAFDELVSRHNYALLTRNQKIYIPGYINHSDDQLAFLSYYPLMRYETDEKLRAIYLQSLERSWQSERPEHNPLWNYIYAASSGRSEYDAAASRATLERIPIDLVYWTVSNAHRRDIAHNPMDDRRGHRQSLLVLPADERPLMRWNGNPFRLDGGREGGSEDDGAFFLLPYWMGRYHRLIR